MAENSGNRTNKALAALTAILFLTCIGLAFKLYQVDRTANDQAVELADMEDERENVQAMLTSTLDDYDDLNIQNDTLRAEVEAQKAKIKDLMEKVKKNKDLGWLLSKARKEAKTLRSIMKGYVVTIDSLNQANQLLTAENLTITQELGEVKGENEALSTQKTELESKLATGSVLHTLAMSTGAIYMRSSGKQVETTRAKKAQMVRSCFTVGANRTTSSGQRSMYLRIISPDGTVLPAADGVGRFDFNGVQGAYSAKRTVDYQNQSMEVCIFWEANGQMTSGEYTAQIYDLGEKIDESTFVLK